MAILTSTVQPSSDTFEENRSNMVALINHWRDLEQRAGNCRPESVLNACSIRACRFYKCIQWQIFALKILIRKPVFPGRRSLWALAL